MIILTGFPVHVFICQILFSLYCKHIPILAFCRYTSCILRVFLVIKYIDFLYYLLSFSKYCHNFCLNYLITYAYLMNHYANMWLISLCYSKKYFYHIVCYLALILFFYGHIYRGSLFIIVIEIIRSFEFFIRKYNPPSYINRYFLYIIITFAQYSHWFQSKHII